MTKPKKIDVSFKPQEKPEVRIRPNSYQPTKTEIEQEIFIDASPEDIIRAAFRQVRIVEDPDA